MMKNIKNYQDYIGKMKKLVLILLVLLVFIVGCEDIEEQEELEKTENEEETDPVDEETGFGGITKQQCEQVDGYWNECGSPCAGTDAEICIQVCQVQCECGGIAGFGCPQGYKCRLTGKIADEMGVCVKR